MPASTSSFRHGVYWEEVPTATVATVYADASTPVCVGLSPVHTLPQFQWLPFGGWAGSGVSPYADVVNVPILTNSYQDAVNGSAVDGRNALGFSTDFANWTNCALINEAYLLNNIGPNVFFNVYDPSGLDAYQVIAPAIYNVVNGQVILNTSNIILTSVVVQDIAAQTTYVNNVDYVLNYQDQNFSAIILTILSGGVIGTATQLSINFAQATPTVIGANEIIGGTDANGNYTGIQAVENVYPKFRLVPGILLAPGFSHIDSVSQALLAKAENISDVFECVAYVDIDSGPDGATNYTAVSQWKDQHNLASNHIYALWPQVQLSGQQCWLSVKAAVTSGLTDFANGNIPFVSPSNKPVAMDTPVLADGTPITITPLQANHLNSIGVATVQNFITGGWRLWGNQTTAYPGDSDIKDQFLCIQRTEQFIGNSLVLTLWQYVDNAGNFRNIEAVVENEQLMLNSLKSAGALIDGRAGFNPADNDLDKLMNGQFYFHLYISPPPPMQAIINILEYDLTQLAELLSGSGIGNPTGTGSGNGTGQ
jgi:uncharacterized protein